MLDTSEESVPTNVFQLQTFKLEARIQRPNLLITSRTPQLITCNSISQSGFCHIGVKNTSATLVRVTTAIVGVHKMEFNVDPRLFELPAHAEQSVKVVFNPISKDRRRYRIRKWCVSRFWLCCNNLM